MQVFVSHYSSDQELAKRLIKELRDAGIDVWSPYDALYPGDNWALEIGTALAASEVMVVLYTRESAGSVTLQREVQYALTSGNYHGRVVPVLVGFVTFQAGKDVPWVLIRMNPVYLESTTADFEPVVKRVQEILETGCNAAT